MLNSPILFFWVCVFHPHSAEIDQKLQEIMKQTGYLKIDGQVSWTQSITSCFMSLTVYNFKQMKESVRKTVFFFMSATT